MKPANPLYYPVAVLAGAIVLVVGVRIVSLPSVVALPVAAAVATAGAFFLKAREPESLGLDNPALEREFQEVKRQADRLVDMSRALRDEAAKLLVESSQMDLLVMVQQACSLAEELPIKIAQLGRRLQAGSSLLEVEELQQQLTKVETKRRTSSGVAYQQLSKLAESLRRNIQLARQGEDARQAQVVSLSTLINDSAGVLQQLQNQLRVANLSDSAQMDELRSLSQEFSVFQENVNLLVSR